MNIVISTLVTSSNLSGVGKYIFRLIDNLQKIDTEHNFYILVNKELESNLALNKSNFHKILIPFPHHPRWLMRPAYFIWQNYSDYFLRTLNPDLIHLPNPIPLFRKGHVSYVVTVHDVAEYSEHRHNFCRRKLRILATDLSVKHSAEVLTVSEFSKNEIIGETGIHKNKIKVTYPGLTIDPNQATVRELTNENKYLLHVGGAQSNKNLDCLIEAYLSSSVQENMNLFLVGEITYMQKSRVELKKLEEKGIYFKGYVSEGELLRYYKQAFALVYPSLYEGFGLPILEAMSLGIPVITSNVTSMPEVAGDAALLVDPKNIVEISDAMKRIVEDKQLRNRLIKKGFERAKVFSWDETARKTIKVYEKAHQSFHLQ